ncbi:kinase-like protein [Dothidotthia symphoricarpi CBS 119687]|uniref:Kinase-like protein n=1 Tax=Dothidotthia symphoricarpi CBS 119687 TaxID=1392245 RepID=A0A6A5ZYT7_9PLEO|nr:kinase-like protein [Dothidotthia symphoricarpi CBS 119687]KAF2124719.1 kinase-like protein [Dothidotthia symphoricarpi CBS 119687]
MPFFSGPQALRLRDLQANPSNFVAMASQSYDYGNNGFMGVFRNKAPHSSHPDFANLTLLVFEAVMEVVCVSLPGYIVARTGHFDAENQKFLANLNTQLFTPFFTKLASQLTADKLSDLAVIPLIFVVQTLVSYLAALIVSRICGFKKRASNFLVAMAVFGNSNSLPISLVISLSKTLSGLHWDKLPGDNDNEVAARGILYLLIFQQLGQLVRWTWGFNVLLAPASTYSNEDGGIRSALESGEYRDHEAQGLLDDSHSDYESGDVTSYTNSTDASDTDSFSDREGVLASTDFVTPTNGNVTVRGAGNFNGNTNGDANGSFDPYKQDNIPKGIKGWPKRTKMAIKQSAKSVSDKIAYAGRRVFQTLPKWLQQPLSKFYSVTARFLGGLWEFMNPPLWAMLVAIIVASVPSLQHLFFDPGTLISNSVTRAVNQSGQVAVPLILVVLGANLARNTLPKEDQHSMEDPKVERNLVIASLVSRMLIPTIFMAPMLALTAKYVPVSILDDPIFIIVCFLLSGAPTALQLAQICQINNVYMGAMSRILFQSYVSAHAIYPTMASSNERVDRHPSPEPSRSNTMEGGSASRPATKVVSFPDESASPMSIGQNKELEQKDYLDLDKSARQYAASIQGKRLSGRPSIERLGSLRPPSVEGNPSLSSLLSDSSAETASHGHHAHAGLLKQVGTWLKHERTRRTARKAKRKAGTKDIAEEVEPAKDLTVESADQSAEIRGRSGSESSLGSVALEELANILEKSISVRPVDAKRKPSHNRKLSAGLKRHSIISTDSDHFDSVDQLVPGCDAVLDISKTMGYTMENSESGPDDEESKKRAQKEKEAWDTFKFEILRLTHTLKLKGWRKVPTEMSSQLDVQRLSGGLTNIVYTVFPPKDLPSQADSADGIPKPKNPPPKLLLRIYGPHVGHLIDRDSELQILYRLVRKRIGPRLLGTFSNGRFEEFLHAKPLTAKELRNEETSKQIAKRMRELHEGIDLTTKERVAGPFVWQNWDKWVDRCEQIGMWLDQQVLETDPNAPLSPADKWKKRGLVCGLEWPMFRKIIEKYRVWLEEQYGGIDKINERLVFSHNDTQYGNILRMMPEGESPLLLPGNQHKQLVVIDFEYANANLPGLEFANHFTEWTYNYHDATQSWKCNDKYYPTADEQHRFLRTYLGHTPNYKAPGAASNPPTPHLGPLPSSTSTTTLAATATATPNSISAFMLDSRAPPGDKSFFQEQELEAERQTEEEARRLMAETRLWRLANSAQWVAWGIVQAAVPGLPDFDAEAKAAAAAVANDGTAADAVVAEKKHSENGSVGGEAAEGGKDGAEREAELFNDQEEDDEFDYLAFAQDRAMFVWGDAVRMGLVGIEELPESVRERLILVEY